MNWFQEDWIAIRNSIIQNYWRHINVLREGSFSVSRVGGEHDADEKIFLLETVLKDSVTKEKKRSLAFWLDHPS